VFLTTYNKNQKILARIRIANCGGSPTLTLAADRKNPGENTNLQTTEKGLKSAREIFINKRTKHTLPRESKPPHSQTKNTRQGFEGQKNRDLQVQPDNKTKANCGNDWQSNW
jgi:hypothetical protein